MLRINLLPVKKIKQQAAAWQQLKIFGFVFAALLAVLIFAVLYLNGKVSGLNIDIAKLGKRKTELAQILKEIEELEKKKEAIKQQTKLIQDLDRTSALTAYILNEVANLTPNDRLWLTSLTQTGSTLSLNGTALDNQTVAEYLDKLEASKYISDVKLANSSLASQGGRSLKSFTLSCTVSMPVPESEKAATADTKGPEPAAQKN